MRSLFFGAFRSGRHFPATCATESGMKMRPLSIAESATSRNNAGGGAFNDYIAVICEFRHFADGNAIADLRQLRGEPSRRLEPQPRQALSPALRR